MLVLGAEGIAGRALMRAASKVDHEAWGTTRGDLDARWMIPGVDITRREDVEQAIGGVTPDVVVNCAGIVKSECDKHDPSHVIGVNALAPHLIATIAKEHGCRVIHLSTDCVFDGSRGARTEDDTTDATDLYGRSKATGELRGYDHCLTIRSSFIGNDPRYGRGLVEWLRQHRGRDIVGWTNALWSGVTAAELSRAIVDAATRQLSGLYNVSGPVVSKADLLVLLNHVLGLSCLVRYANEPHIDRTLDDARYRAIVGRASPRWIDMAQELANETPRP